jgi:hypothetical protein
VRIKTGQKMYKVQGPDGLWVQKREYGSFSWVKNEETATFWKKLSHLKNALKQGVLFPQKGLIDGLPLEALKVVEFVVTVQRTRRRHRLTELDKFYVVKEEPHGEPEDV